MVSYITSIHPLHSRQSFASWYPFSSLQVHIFTLVFSFVFANIFHGIFISLVSLVHRLLQEILFYPEHPIVNNTFDMTHSNTYNHQLLPLLFTLSHIVTAHKHTHTPMSSSNSLVLLEDQKFHLIPSFQGYPCFQVHLESHLLHHSPFYQECPGFRAPLEDHHSQLHQVLPGLFSSGNTSTR